MKKKFSKILGVSLAVALIASLVVMAAPVGADPGYTEKAGSLGADTGNSAVWSTTKVHPSPETLTAMGVYSAKLFHAPAANRAWVKFIPPAGITLAEFVVAPTTYGFWYNLSVGADLGPQLELTFTDGTAGSSGSVEMTAEAALYDVPGTGVWLKKTLSAASECLYYGTTPDGSSFDYGGPPNSTVLTLLTDINTDATAADAGTVNASSWELTQVLIDLGWGGSAAKTCYIDDVTIDGERYDLEPDYWLEPAIAKNVKTADETFTVMDVFGEVPGYQVSNWVVTKGEGIGMVTVIAGGNPNPLFPTVPGNNFITVRMVTTGDCIITADVAGLPTIVNAEKKWGEIFETVLTAWSPTPDDKARPTGATDTQHPRSSIVPGDLVLVQEEVIAEFLPGPVPAPAGGAKVTWWLLTNDELDKAQIALENLIARFDTYDYEIGDLGWGYGYGQYSDWAGDPTFIPEDILNAIYALYGANKTVFTKAEGADIVDTTKTLTYTDHVGDPLGEGLTNVTVEFFDITTGDAEPVIVVVLADYPLDKNGQNVVAVEYFKFSPKIPVPPAQVKTTQLRWAGEKIVLEKEWGTEYYDPVYGGNLVMFALEEGSIGVLIPLFDIDVMSPDSRTVFTEVGSDGVARVMFKTEQQGEVDVECVLYGEYSPIDASFDQLVVTMPDWAIVANTGFVVYYMFIEEVTPQEPAPQPVEPDECARFFVDVKGTFWTTSLPGTTREARIITFETDVGTVEYELPAGRYVLPDDWPLMAGPNWRTLRPWMDLMAEPFVEVSSTYWLGPFSPVNSPSGVAAVPSIGPFSSRQPWSTLKKWVTDGLVVPADGAIDMDPFTAGIVNQSWPTRNTVIPDNLVTPADAPMPPAEIHFVITAASPPVGVTPSLSDAWKDTVYSWPFYASEIPANPFIPPMLGTDEGYWWNSWEFGAWTPEGAYTPNTPAGVLNREGPYWFYIDLEQTPLATSLEVYSDNLGTAAVYIDALGGAGTVTIEAKADYPYLPAKFPGVVSDEVTQVWGPIELNPHFLADDTLVEAGDTVTFTNLTAGGTLPYTDADWNWGDGTTHGITAVNNGETITHVYNTPGVYSVILTMTDSTPTTRWEERPDYITVTGEVADILAYYRALTGDLLVADLADVVAAANDFLGGVIPPGFTAPITLSQLVELANDWLGL